MSFCHDALFDYHFANCWFPSALKSGHVSAVGLDVYERESNYFFADSSAKVITDDSFSRLLTFYNVFMTLVSISPSYFVSHLHRLQWASSFFNPRSIGEYSTDDGSEFA